MANNSLALPDDLMQLLSAADRNQGFPSGTMASLLSQEIGGRQDILNKPDTYHYPADASGRRIAKHTGKVSTAFGPFGILESTAKDPGYGVAPLKDKSLAEQVRFASEYLGARSKSAGSLHAGLAGYGEGEKYSRQVARRRDGGATQMAPVQVAEAPTPPLQTPAAELPISFAGFMDQGAPATEAPPVFVARADLSPAMPQVPLMPAPADLSKDPWTQHLKNNPIGAEPVAVATAPAVPRPAAMPINEDYAQLAAMELSNRPNFGMFQGLSRLGRRAA